MSANSSRWMTIVLNDDFTNRHWRIIKCPLRNFHTATEDKSRSSWEATKEPWQPQSTYWYTTQCPPQSRQAIPTLSNFRHQHPDIARSPEIVVGRTTKSRHDRYCPPQVRFGSRHIHMWRPSGQKPQVETSYSLFFRLKYWFVTRKVRKIICKCVSEVHFFA